METVAEEPLCGMCHCQFVLLVLVLFHFHFYLFIVGYGDTILKLTMTCGQGFKFIFEFSLSSLLFFSLDQNSEVKQKLGASEKDKEVYCLEITSDSLACEFLLVHVENGLVLYSYFAMQYRFVFSSFLNLCSLCATNYMCFCFKKIIMILHGSQTTSKEPNFHTLQVYL